MWRQSSGTFQFYSLCSLFLTSGHRTSRSSGLHFYFILWTVWSLIWIVNQLSWLLFLVDPVTAGHHHFLPHTPWFITYFTDYVLTLGAIIRHLLALLLNKPQNKTLFIHIKSSCCRRFSVTSSIRKCYNFFALSTLTLTKRCLFPNNTPTSKMVTHWKVYCQI
jgi:hypothetical protein